MNAGALANGLKQLQVRPLRTAEQHQQLLRVAAEDNHLVIGPTHLVTRGEEIVGYGSIGGVMLVTAWVHTGKVRARDSWGLLNTAENLAAGLGAAQIALPCAESSPFHPFLDGLGYARLGATTFNLKKL